jgi:hypothetical protein
VLHQSGFPQILHGRFFETLLYPVAVIFSSRWAVSRLFLRTVSDFRDPIRQKNQGQRAGDTGRQARRAAISKGMSSRQTLDLWF